MRRIGNGIVVEAHAEIQGETRPNRPLISAKPGDLVLLDRKTSWPAKVDLFKCRTCRTDDRYRQELLTPLVRTVREVKANLQFVVAQKMLWAEMVDLLPLDSTRISILSIKEAAFCGFDQHLIRSLTVGKCVCVKLFIGEPRGKQSARLRNVAVLRRNLISTLV